MRNQLLLSALLPLFIDACSSGATSPCESGSAAVVGCLPGHETQVLASSTAPRTTSGKIPVAPFNLHLAVDGAFVYYTTLAGDVMRVPKAGGVATKLSNAMIEPVAAGESCVVTSLALGTTRVYWSVACGELSLCESGNWQDCARHSIVAYAPRDGAAAATVLMRGDFTRVDSIATHDDDVYVVASTGSATSLFDVPSKSAPLDTVFESFPGLVMAQGSSVVWGGRTQPRVASELRAVGASGVATPVVSSGDRITAAAIDAGSLYWISESSGAGEVTRALRSKRLDASATATEDAALVTGRSAPRVFAVDASGFYGAGSDDGPTDIAHWTASGAERETLAILGDSSGGMHVTSALALDDEYVYWIDHQDKCITASGGAGTCVSFDLTSSVARVHKH